MPFHSVTPPDTFGSGNSFTHSCKTQKCSFDCVIPRGTCICYTLRILSEEQCRHKVP